MSIENGIVGLLSSKVLFQCNLKVLDMVIFI